MEIPSPQPTSQTISEFLNIPGLEYHANILTPSHQSQLYHHLTHTTPASWKTLKNRRLQNHGGLPHIRGTITTPLPRNLHPLTELLVKYGVFKKELPPNHVLVNWYEGGQGISAHVDGPVFEDVAGIFSIGSGVVMEFWKEGVDGDEGGRSWLGGVWLEVGSLLVLKGEAYTGVLHGICEREFDEGGERIWGLRKGVRVKRGRRFSFTVRRCRKTLKTKIKLSNG